MKTRTRSQRRRPVPYGGLSEDPEDSSPPPSPYSHTEVTNWPVDRIRSNEYPSVLLPAPSNGTITSTYSSAKSCDSPLKASFLPHHPQLPPLPSLLHPSPTSLSLSSSSYSKSVETYNPAPAEVEEDEPLFDEKRSRSESGSSPLSEDRSSPESEDASGVLSESRIDITEEAGGGTSGRTRKLRSGPVLKMVEENGEGERELGKKTKGRKKKALGGRGRMMRDRSVSVEEAGEGLEANPINLEVTILNDPSLLLRINYLTVEPSTDTSLPPTASTNLLHPSSITRKFDSGTSQTTYLYRAPTEISSVGLDIRSKKFRYGGREAKKAFLVEGCLIKVKVADGKIGFAIR